MWEEERKDKNARPLANVDFLCQGYAKTASHNCTSPSALDVAFALPSLSFIGLSVAATEPALVRHERKQQKRDK